MGRKLFLFLKRVISNKYTNGSKSIFNVYSLLENLNKFLTHTLLATSKFELKKNIFASQLT